MAEIELSVLARQCLDGRIPDHETLRHQAAPWEGQRNENGTNVDRRFTVSNTRITMKRLYSS